MAALLALLASALWGTADFLGGTAARRLPVASVLGVSQLVALLGLVPLAASIGALDEPRSYLLPALFAGLTGTAALACFYRALATGTMGVVAPVTSLGVVVPVVVGLLSGESPSSVVWIGIVVAIAGIVLTSGPELTGGVSARPVVIAAVAGVFFGIFFVFADRGAEDSPLLTLWAMRATVAAVFVAIAVVKRTTGGLAGRDVWLVIVVAAGDLGANLSFAIASTKGFVSITSVLSSLFPVVTVLLARAVLKERLRSVQIIGVAVTMLGVACISAG